MEALSRQCRQGRAPSQDCRQCQAKSHGRLLELSVPTERCPHDRAGHCLMCNYGTGERVTDLHAFSTQVGDLLHRYRPETLLLSTNGSVLDDACLPPAAQELLLAEAAASPARTVILETHPVEYRCYCSRERVTRALVSMGRQELASLIAEQGQAELTCQFCDKVYRYTKEELEELLDNDLPFEASYEAAPPPMDEDAPVMSM